MLNNLKAEMKRSQISQDTIAKQLDITSRTFRNKVNGITEFTRDEMFRLRDKFFPDLNIEYLFHFDRDVEAEAMQFEETNGKPKR